MSSKISDAEVQILSFIFIIYCPFVCVWLPGRMGAHQCEGELGRGSSRSTPSSRRPLTQPGAPTASASSERERHVRVALPHSLLVLFPQPCLCLDLHRVSLLRPFKQTLIPSCKGTCTITPPGLDCKSWLDLKLDRWMNVTRWLVSQTEIMSVFTDESECMFLLFLGFGYWMSQDLAIAFIRIHSNLIRPKMVGC